MVPQGRNRTRHACCACRGYLSPAPRLKPFSGPSGCRLVHFSSGVGASVELRDDCRTLLTKDPSALSFVYRPRRAESAEHARRALSSSAAENVEPIYSTNGRFHFAIIQEPPAARREFLQPHASTHAPREGLLQEVDNNQRLSKASCIQACFSLFHREVRDIDSTVAKSTIGRRTVCRVLPARRD